MPSLPATAVLTASRRHLRGRSTRSPTPTSAPAVGKYPRQAADADQQGGGYEPVSKYFPLTAQEHAVADDEFVEITGEGMATTKSAYNKVFSDSVAGLAQPASH